MPKKKTVPEKPVQPKDSCPYYLTPKKCPWTNVASRKGGTDCPWPKYKCGNRK